MTFVDFPDVDGLVLDSKTHRYSWSGQPVGGVSEILQSLGIVDPRFFTDYSRERGTAVHSAVQLLAQGRLDWGSVDPRIEGYVKAGELFLIEAGIVAGDALTENLVFSRVHRYAGKLDLFASVFGQKTVVDFKSGAVGCAGLQTAAYEMALREELDATVPFRRMAVQLRDDGTYRMEEFTRNYDYIDWAACCRIFNTYHAKRKKDHNE